VTDSVTGTTGTNATTGTTAGTSKTSTDDFGAGMGKDTFLKLLVAQLKYQNPLQPTDGQEYMAQMAQFTTVEKLADIQKAQTDLVSWQRAVAGQGMIGKQITATLASTGTEITGVVSGMKFTDAGPRLVLSNGTTVAVDEVTSVTAASSATTSSAPASATSSGSSSGTGTSTNTSTSTGTSTTGATSTTATGTTTAGTGTGTTGSGATGTAGSGATGSGTTGTTSSGATTTGSGSSAA
jgi:flagellar basal-body rod modification protein FlgD